MVYHLITFVDGLEEKCSVEKYTEQEIRDLCKGKREIISIRQGEIVVEKKEEKKELMFEVRMSFDDTKNLFITVKELPFAYFAMENNTILYIAGGAIRGQNIIDILPDYNSYMEWNRDYKPTPEDYALIQPIVNLFRDKMQEIKWIVRKSGGDQKALVKELVAVSDGLYLK